MPFQDPKTILEWINGYQKAIDKNRTTTFCFWMVFHRNHQNTSYCRYLVLRLARVERCIFNFLFIFFMDQGFPYDAFQGPLERHPERSYTNYKLFWNAKIHFLVPIGLGGNVVYNLNLNYTLPNANQNLKIDSPEWRFKQKLQSRLIFTFPSWNQLYTTTSLRLDLTLTSVQRPGTHCFFLTHVSL